MHRPSRAIWMTLAAAFAIAAIPAAADAQSMAERLRRRAEEAAKRKVEERTDRKAGEATDAALDKAECAIPGSKCPANAAGANQQGGSTAGGASGGASAGSSSAAATEAMSPGEGAWRNFDFVPGERVVFSEDYNRDNVGDFPKRMEFISGNLEIIEWNGSRFLSTNTWSRFAIPLPENLPERFTLEFDYAAAGGNHAEIRFVNFGEEENEAYASIGTWNGGLRGRNTDAVGQPGGDQYKYDKVVFPVKIMADGPHVKVYMGDTRVANVPNGNLGRTKKIYFQLPGTQDRAAMVGNIRIAAGGRRLYDALSASGRVATQGIYFDTGSDRIRPESSPTLKEIGTMLQQHADLKLVIEGHTDNVGDAGANMTLSQKRAEAVRAHLVSSYSIDGSRLAARGMGVTKPAAPNTTAEGRQQNRRVELVKQ